MANIHSKFLEEFNGEEYKIHLAKPELKEAILKNQTNLNRFAESLIVHSTWLSLADLNAWSEHLKFLSGK